jgi:hypothetical protein
MARMCTVLIAIFCVFSAGNATAAFYTWVDEKGVTHISDTPVPQGNKEIKYRTYSDSNSSSSGNEEDWFKCSEMAIRADDAALTALREFEEWKSVPATDIEFGPKSSGRTGDVAEFSFSVYRKSVRQNRGVRVLFKSHPTDWNLCRYFQVRVWDGKAGAGGRKK